MSVVFHCPWDNAAVWIEALRAAGPEFTFETWPRVADPGAVDLAVLWAPPRALFEALPRIRGIAVLGAGVDHLFKAGDALPDVPIARLVDPVMAERMAHYVLAAALRHQRQLDAFERQQRERAWIKRYHRDAGEVGVGIMGLGVLGQACARLFIALGFRVCGWSRTPKDVPGVAGYHGDAQLRDFLAASDVLVCLLPSTPATRFIVDAAALAALPRGACVINPGRGELVDVPALLDALDRGHLAGATLDVFEREPLPPDSPLWKHPLVLVTPHVASLSNPATGSALLVDALRRMRDGDPVPHLIDRARRY